MRHTSTHLSLVFGRLEQRLCAVKRKTGNQYIQCAAGAMGRMEIQIR